MSGRIWRGTDGRGLREAAVGRTVAPPARSDAATAHPAAVTAPPAAATAHPAAVTAPTLVDE
ncbi:hypothetical protein ACIOJE_10410 [Kitasatospora sp. NPDC087861]|uniref:hypothetical protein n=1 Tax=Kitasatospora sp. NPDC087861 TaxID=3364070 RepID=UPI0037FE0840